MRTLIALAFASTLFTACSGHDAAPQDGQAPTAPTVTVQLASSRHITSAASRLAEQRRMGPAVRVAARHARR